MTIDPLNLPKEYYRRFFVHHALYKIFDKKTSVEDRTQLTTTAKSCIADGQLKTLLIMYSNANHDGTYSALIFMNMVHCFLLTQNYSEVVVN